MSTFTGTSLPLARLFAQAIVGARAEAIAPSALRHAVHLFVNWMGCVLGGFDEPSVAIAHEVLLENAGAPVATAIGRNRKVDVLTAALMNSLSASGYAFDEAHPETAIHPVGPTASAIFSLSERSRVSGPAAMLALLLGIEVACRMGRCMMACEGSIRPAFSPTGLFGSIAAAVAAAKILQLREDESVSAIGLAAVHGGGFRETIGSMAGNYTPAHTVRGGLVAALLARKGYTCTPTSLEGTMGFAAAFGNNIDFAHAADNLETFREACSVACKPYPCGMWVLPVIDICLAWRSNLDPTMIDRVEIAVHPRAIAVAGRSRPTTRLEALASLSHWAAATLVRGRAGVAEGGEDCIADRAVRDMAERIAFRPDSALLPDQAHGAVQLTDGRTLRGQLDHCRGGPHRPMNDREVDAKFLAQAEPVLGMASAKRLLAALRDTPGCEDVAAHLGTHLVPTLAQSQV
jgi:2-methylcitrate dehydratase PrpD